MKDDRRAFLRTVGGVSAGLAGATALGARADALPAATSRAEGGGLHAAAAKPTFSAAHFALELEGILIGMLRGFSGGHASAPVVQEDGGADCVVRKALGKASYADLVLSLAGSPSPEVQDWILEMLSCQEAARSGAILSLDANHKELHRLDFKSALLTEISFPALGAAEAKSPFVFTLRCQPVSTQRGKGSGEKVTIPASKVKAPLASNFLLTMKGLETTKVTRVDSLKITRGVLAAESEGKALAIPGKVDVGDLTVTVPETMADTWSDWHQSFVVEGKSGSESEKSATLELLAPNLKSVLFAVHLGSVGIYDLEGAPLETNQQEIRKVVARMYCEEIAFKF